VEPIITFGVVFLTPKFLPSRVIACVEAIGRLGGHRPVTEGMLKLTRFTLRDLPDCAETSKSKAPPKPEGDLQMMTLDEIQTEDSIEVLCNVTLKEIIFNGNWPPNKVMIAAPVRGEAFGSEELTDED